jgi:gluconate 2-dehydrogenase gamma chain
MAKKTDIRSHLSRRDLLKQVGVVGAAVAVPVRVELLARASAQGTSASIAPARDALETLTSAEAETLQAIVARLIPSDAAGPGAAEARAARYIDRALGGALSSSREAYRTGLAALDRYARASKGQDFARLTPPDQDAVLTALETNTAAGFAESASFFELVLSHTIQGTFCDPYYGGNADFVGWDLLSYPGIRLAVAADDQRIDARPAPTHTSAYDHAMFSKKKPARARAGGKDFDHAG